MRPRAGQGANQAIEDAVALATVPSRAERVSAPRALLIYEALRRERTARIQRLSRLNGAVTGGDLEVRDRQLDAQARDRAWIWDYDAEAEASVAAAPL
jgi:salicylate hydroxylase